MAKKKTIQKKEDNYKLVLKVAGKEFTSEGASMSDALLSLKPGTIRSRGILTLTKGAYTKERILQPRQMLSVFGHQGLTQQINIKRITTLFI